MSKTVKNMLATIVNTMIRTGDREQTLAVYKKEYEDFKNYHPAEISFRSSIKTYDKYNARTDGLIKALHTYRCICGYKL